MVGPTVGKFKRSIDNEKTIMLIQHFKRQNALGKIVRFKKLRRYTSISIIASSGEQSIRKEHEIKTRINIYCKYKHEWNKRQNI